MRLILIAQFGDKADVGIDFQHIGQFLKLGARMIVESDRGLDLAAVVAYEHHIMLDGGGYPGMHFCRECHHASRLVHVCDVYDALRTKRPYREAWDAERALKQIEQGAGTDFDPDLVRAFSGMMREWERREAEVGDEDAARHE